MKRSSSPTPTLAEKAQSLGYPDLPEGILEDCENLHVSVVCRLHLAPQHKRLCLRMGSVRQEHSHQLGRGLAEFLQVLVVSGMSLPKVARLKHFAGALNHKPSTSL